LIENLSLAIHDVGSVFTKLYECLHVGDVEQAVCGRDRWVSHAYVVGLEKVFEVGAWKTLAVEQLDEPKDCLVVWIE
jgi:hypothetical protein